MGQIQAVVVLAVCYNNYAYLVNIPKPFLNIIKCLNPCYIINQDYSLKSKM